MCNNNINQNPDHHPPRVHPPRVDLLLHEGRIEAAAAPYSGGNEEGEGREERSVEDVSQLLKSTHFKGCI